MCGTCNGFILLRSADGMTKQVKVGNCDLKEWRVPYLCKDILYSLFTASAFDAVPAESIYKERTYRRSRYHEELDGLPVFDEVVETPPKSQRRIVDIEALLLDEVLDDSANIQD